LGSRRYRSSPNPLLRIHIRNSSLEKEEEELFAKLCCPIVEVLFLLKKTNIIFPSLIKKLRRIKEQGAKEDASSPRYGFDVSPSH
jgi:hypothetical protein